MATFPLPTMACAVDANGITAPPFSDILSNLQLIYQGLYGADIYLGNDSADGQWLGVLTAMVDDSNQATIATYNQFSPQTAVGVGLSQVVKVNGLRRLIPSNSGVPVAILGVAGTTINSGLLQDTLGNQWLLPSSVTIPDSGTVTVTAVCQTPGAIGLGSGVALTIITPVPGWQSATTTSTATRGSPVEPDTALRQRQSISTAQPATTPLDAIAAAVANLTGVLEIRVYENDTPTTDTLGIPGHSIAVVANGGDAVAIATAIANKKAPGTGTFGTTSEVVIDPLGVPNTISFYFASAAGIRFLITIKALAGYVSTTGNLLISSLVRYVNDLGIGNKVYYNKLWPAANLSGDAATAVTGLPQSQLDALAATYNITLLAPGRVDVIVTGGPYGAGTTTVNVANANDLTIGYSIYLVLDNGAIFGANITGISGSAVTFTPAVPSLRSIPNGSYVHTNGDLPIAFYEMAVSSGTNATLIVT
jgi:uncharacterized phage protein gp47/JayE